MSNPFTPRVDRLSYELGTGPHRDRSRQRTLSPAESKAIRTLVAGGVQRLARGSGVRSPRGYGAAPWRTQVKRSFDRREYRETDP